MIASAADVVVAIDLAGDCVDEGCRAHTQSVGGQLRAGAYDWPASVVPLDDFALWLAEHRTARRRSARSRRLGYFFREISLPDYVNDIWEINTSLPERQGRPMAASYLAEPAPSTLPTYHCPRHAIRTFGVLFDAGVGPCLVAYLSAYYCGDLLMVSQILGHGDYLADDVMYLLAVGTFEATLESPGPVVAFYNRHDSGTDGLRYYKERLGFRPRRAEWLV